MMATTSCRTSLSREIHITNIERVKQNVCTLALDPCSDLYSIYTTKAHEHHHNESRSLWFLLVGYMTMHSRIWPSKNPNKQLMFALSVYNQLNCLLFHISCVAVQGDVEVLCQKSLTTLWFWGMLKFLKSNHLLIWLIYNKKCIIRGFIALTA